MAGKTSTVEDILMNNVLHEFYRNKKVLLTGHTGFKGSWLAFWLKTLGAHVTGVALEPEYENSLFEKLSLSNIIDTHFQDIRDYAKLEAIISRTEPDIVFHLAAQALVRRSYEDPMLTFSTNVMGSLNLLESIRHCPSIRSLVYITSDKCYWNNEWTWGYRESDSLGGPDPYSASKACAEHVFKSYFLSYFRERPNFGCASTRAGNVIGGGDRAKDRIVPDIIRAIEKSTPIFLRNPQSTRPWQHVLDPLHGYLCLAMALYNNPSQLNGEAWNFGPSNQSIKMVYELAELLLDFWPETSIETNTLNKNYHESNLLHLSIDKAQSLLKWVPKYHFKHAVSQVGSWYKRVHDGEDPKQVTTEQITHFMECKETV